MNVLIHERILYWNYKFGEIDYYRHLLKCRQHFVYIKCVPFPWYRCSIWIEIEEVLVHKTNIQQNKHLHLWQLYDDNWMKTWKPFKKEKAVTSVRIEGLDKKEKQKRKREDDRRQKKYTQCSLASLKPWSMDYISLLTKSNKAMKIHSVSKDNKIKCDMRRCSNRI